jgi:Zn-dependent protease
MNLNIILIVETFIAFVLAITIHEAAHAVMAGLLGDTSPRGAGRLSLAPARQMTAIGTIVAIVFSFSGIAPAGLGWGRTVDVDARRMRVGPNLGLILVALAGPLVNLALAIGIAFLLTVLPGYAHLPAALDNSCTFALIGRGEAAGQALQSCLNAAQPTYLLRIEQFAFTFAVTNLVLALINIIPLHPLDGYRVLFALLPSPQAITFRKYEPYMELILLVIFFLVPFVLAFVGINFSPGRIIIDGANNVLANIAPNIWRFYLAL